MKSGGKAEKQVGGNSQINNQVKPESPKEVSKPTVQNSLPPQDNRTPLEKKAHKLLKNHGMLDAYKYVLANICKDGLPQGDVFEYAAHLFGNYEKKWKLLKSKETKEKIMKYKEEKQKSKIEGSSSLNNSVNHGRSSPINKNIKKSTSTTEISSGLKSKVLDKDKSKVEIVKKDQPVIKEASKEPKKNEISQQAQPKQTSSIESVQKEKKEEKAFSKEEKPNNNAQPTANAPQVNAKKK